MYEIYYCPRCQTQVTRNTTVCPKCGARLSGVRQVQRCIRCGRLTPIEDLRGGRCPSCVKLPGYSATSKKIASKIVLVVLILFSFVGAVLFWVPRLETVGACMLYAGLTTLVIGVILYFLFRLKATLYVLGYLSYALSITFLVISLMILLKGIAFIGSLVARLPANFANSEWWIWLIVAALLALGGYGLVHDAREV